MLFIGMSLVVVVAGDKKCYLKVLLPCECVWLCTCSCSAPNVESIPPPNWGRLGRLVPEAMSRFAHLPGPPWSIMGSNKAVTNWTGMDIGIQQAQERHEYRTTQLHGWLATEEYIIYMSLYRYNSLTDGFTLDSPMYWFHHYGGKYVAFTMFLYSIMSPESFSRVY